MTHDEYVQLTLQSYLTSQVLCNPLGTFWFFFLWSSWHDFLKKVKAIY
jgi:hypothetical protein